ncbi:predicted protein [Nematostella vectensis]|uniref:Deleted in lung and esophageal cancer protein 1 Ig-like domain-containing protein n=1 Tax=Nematostella vectensis TaxID=45351 RepID=A7RRN0_NEMVE|nr:predicted protein [Nematostella vectensis]|eukprot:XP_001637852.1 predicted protein [Nematostella vectensis]
MKMADANGKEVEPPMHIQRPSSARSQDVSHILASVFRELFTRDSVGEQRVKHLATSRSGEETYHDKYVQQLRKIQQDRDQCHREADMLETHIMQAQAAAMAADERDIQKALVECEDYQKLGLPPGKSNLRHCLDTELLRKFGLIVPQDFTSEDPKPARPPQAADIPSYARCTTSSQQRFRKTPPLTDYVTTSSLAYPFAASKQTSLAHEQGLRESPPPQTAKTKQSKTSAWKDSMKPNQRKVERDDLQRLESKAEYKQNLRFVPPEAAELIQKKTKHRSKTKTTSQDKSGFKAVEVFLVSPNPLVFTDYNVGEVYELSIELKNVTSSSRQVRVVPPTSKHFSIGLGRFPGENGVVAPGMSCVYPIRFAPDSLADYDDLIKIKSQVDPPLIVHLQARRPPPSLSLPPTLRCGHCLVGGYKAVRMYCTNSGGDGRFCLIPKTQWPTASFKWTLEDPGSVNVNPFEIEPAMFQLRKGESTTIKITFSPYAATFFKQEIAMVCDNCQVKSFSVEGTGQMAGIQFMSISGGLSQYDVGEMKDVSSKFLVRFDHQNPQTNHSKILEIKNTTARSWYMFLSEHAHGISQCTLMVYVRTLSWYMSEHAHGTCFYLNTLIVYVRARSWYMSEHAHGTCFYQNTLMVHVRTRYWYMPEHAHGICQNTLMVCVKTPSWYMSEHAHGICQNTLLVYVRARSWYMSEHAHSICQNTLMVYLSARSWYMSEHAHGTCFYQNTLMVYVRTRSWYMSEHAHGICQSTLMVYVRTRSWYMFLSEHAHGICQNTLIGICQSTLMVYVRTRSWYVSKHPHGICQNTLMVYVRARYGICQNTLMVYVRTRSWYMSKHAHGICQSTLMVHVFIRTRSCNVSLPFRWKLFKPFLPSVSQEPTGRVHRVPDDQGVFSVTPNMGALPPHEVVHFSLENAPKEVGSFHGVAHMVLEEIPVQGGDAAGSIAKDVTAIEIEVKAECKPFYIEVSPALLVIPGRMMLGTPYLYSVKIQNNSVSRSSFEWQDIKTDDYAVSIEPRSGVLGAGEMVELCVSVFGNSPDSMDATLTCYVPFSSSPVFLRVKGNFQGPEVLIGLPDLNFGLVRLGKSSKSTIPIKNTSIVRADWSMEECSDMTQDVSEFTFVPSHGSLGPMEEITCEVTFGPTQCRRVRSVFQCAVRKGKTSYLSVFSEVQTPLVCLVSSSLYIEDVYLNVPVSREVVLQNHTLLATHFQWKEIVDDKGDKGYTVTFEPSSGELGPRQALPVQMTFTGHRKGPLESLVTSCEVTGMDKPIWLDISTDVRGLNVTFETPKLLDLRRPDEIKTVDIESTPLLLEFETVPLGEQGKATLVMTNTSAIRARYSLHVEHFKAAKPPSPPEGQPKNKNSRRLQGLLARTPNIADPLSKTATKAQADHSATVLRDGRGAAFILSPCEGELLPFGYQVVEVSAYNDMWGDYRDLLVCQVEGLDPVYIPIKMTVVGCPLNFQMMKDQAPILRFGTHVSGAPSVQRSLRLNNTSPFDIRLDWGTYNIIRDDPQLLDMLVFYGQPLPLFDSKGQEQIPSPPPLPDSLCDELPLIQVKLQEHDGILSSKPFGVTPSQQIIPAKSHATMNVTFTPHTDDPEGEACICYAAAYMSLDGQNVNIPGRVSRKQGLEMARFRLDVTANIRPALLSVEMEEDKGAHFTTAASDVLKGDATKVHRFVMSNTTETPLNFRLEIPAPFRLVCTEPPPSAKSSRPVPGGLTTVKPGKNIEVKVGFCLTRGLLELASSVDESGHDGCSLITKETGNRQLVFNRDLVVFFSNNTKQLIPLTASVDVPTFRLSEEVLDFGICLVGQEKELDLTLENPAESDSTWMVEHDPRYPDVTREVFSITPSEGFLEGHYSHVSKNKTLLKVTFTARHNVKYKCVVMFRGRLQEQVQRLTLIGQGSYDGHHEALINVMTEF